jgi:3,4-dihydroxy 2-butanone 4-phosphate synthase/GTP cyclohydrolase II
VRQETTVMQRGQPKGPPERGQAPDSSLAAAYGAWRSGSCLVLLDDVSAVPTARLAFPAETATPDQVAFAIRHGSGYLSVALTAADADRLDIPVMPTAHCAGDVEVAVSVDAASHTTTGISATDRARTLALLGSRRTHAADFSRPGHVAVTRVKRPATDSAESVEGALLQLSESVGKHPAVALVDLVGIADPTRLADVDESITFAAKYDLATCRVSAVVAQLLRPAALRRAAEVCVRGGRDIRAVAYRTGPGHLQHVAFIRGDISDRDAQVDVHVECDAGSVFGSAVCRCGDAMNGRLARLRSHNGVLLVIREARAAEASTSGRAVEGRLPYTGCANEQGPDQHALTGCGASIALEILADLGIEPNQAKAIPALAGADLSASSRACKLLTSRS